MKKLILAFAAVTMLLSACVTKQKYIESVDDLNQCKKERSTLTSQNVNLTNQVTELEAAKNVLSAQVKQLRQDTTTLGKLNREMTENLATTQKNYDDLLVSFKNMSTGSKKETETMLKRLQESKDKLDAKERELNALSEDLKKKTADLEQQQAKLAELQAILDKKDADVLALQNKIKQALKGFEGTGLQVTERNGKVYVSMEEKLLFQSGKFTIDARGEQALKELAKVLEVDTTINVMVEGHTDNVPFSPASSSQIRDNWDLSVMRATTIVKTILKAVPTINPQRLTAAGRGEFVPIDNQDSQEARAKNRRTEIILTPNLNALFDVLK